MQDDLTLAIVACTSLNSFWLPSYYTSERAPPVCVVRIQYANRLRQTDCMICVDMVIQRRILVRVIKNNIHFSPLVI